MPFSWLSRTPIQKKTATRYNVELERDACRVVYATILNARRYQFSCYRFINAKRRRFYVSRVVRSTQTNCGKSRYAWENLIWGNISNEKVLFRIVRFCFVFQFVVDAVFPQKIGIEYVRDSFYECRASKVWMYSVI